MGLKGKRMRCITLSNPSQSSTMVVHRDVLERLTDNHRRSPPPPPLPPLLPFQCLSQTPCTPLFGGRSRSIPQGMVLDVSPLVKSLQVPDKMIPQQIF